VILDVQLRRNVRNIWQFTGEATVDGKTAASAEIMCAAKEIDD